MGLFRKGRNTILEGSDFMTNHLAKAQSPNTLTVGTRFQHMNLVVVVVRGVANVQTIVPALGDCVALMSVSLLKDVAAARSSQAKAVKIRGGSQTFRTL